MNNPRFSIITITFNSGRTVERTLKSVLAQSYTDFEYIIVDGASKDSTMEIVRKYEHLFDGRMKVKSEPDKGIYDAMNKGILRSMGTVIGIVNSDDWLEPDALENVNRVFEENGCSEDMIYTGGIRFHKDNGDVTDLYPNINLFNKKAQEYIMAGIRHPATFVPKSIYNKIGSFDTRIVIMADTDFLLRAYYKHIRILPIEKIVSNMADGGLSNLLTWKVGKRSFEDKNIMLSKFTMSSPKRYYILLKALGIIVAKRTVFKAFIKHK